MDQIGATTTYLHLARYAEMEKPRPPAELTDQELLREWECIDCETEDTARTDALAAELERRQLDF